MKTTEYLDKEPQREFMAKIAREVNKVDWMMCQVGDEEVSANVYSKQYKYSIMSKLLTLTQEQSIKVLLKVIEAQNIAPLFKEYPAENVMSEARILSFESCHFDF